VSSRALGSLSRIFLIGGIKVMVFGRVPTVAALVVAFLSLNEASAPVPVFRESVPIE
jgi:hypothetical protein